jgi:hydrogenase/urease accessory protein HupE
MRLLVLACALFASLAFAATAHESRPAYLEIREIGLGHYDALWKRPMRGDLVLPLSVLWPEGCRTPTSGREQLVPGAVVQRMIVECAGPGLAGGTIAIEGLDGVSADVLVRIELADTPVQTTILRPATPRVVVSAHHSTLSVATDYLVLGIEHILAGIDHLLFVLCLTLIVSGRRRLVETITAFTLAHSITLALATLGVLRVAQAPVEAVIALSIVFVARELVQMNAGRPGLTGRKPWLVAFVFGLLHGLGFAGALREVGLPQTDIPMALLSFNVGVEIGQLAFVGAVLAAMALWRRAFPVAMARVAQVPAYAVGAIAAYWTLERLLTA